MATTAPAATIIPSLAQRPVQKTLCLFDVDGTLTPARSTVSPAMLSLLSALRHRVAIGFVGGSDLLKQQEQLATPEIPVQSLFDFCFAENGLTAFRMGEPLANQNFISWIGEERYKKLVRFLLHYIADLEVPVKRGTFVEFRNGMINVSPIGRNASQQERREYEVFDLKHRVREKFIEAIKREFPDYGLTYSIGGQISFDVFPKGWDKTYCLQHVENEVNMPDRIEYTTIHFFGDKAFEGGNDWEIYSDPRTVGHKVKNPEETMELLREMFGV